MNNQFDFSRREFLSFLGGSVAALATPAIGFSAPSLGETPPLEPATPRPTIKSLPASTVDDLVLADGIRSSILIRYGDVINAAGERFGFNNDFIAFFPLHKDEALLWVNHESPQGGLMHGNPGVLLGGTPKTAEQVREEQLAVGGSIIRILRDSKTGEWRFGGNHALNRRISGLTKIPFARGVSIAGASVATGTLANCAGGVTPWGTALTCEENYQEFYGELKGPGGPSWEKQVKMPDHHHGWTEHAKMHPWHYGWVVEINPRTGRAQKLVAMGRASREGATVTLAKDGRAVVYSGDDFRGGCIFKFVSDKPRDLTRGTLYAADVGKGRWIELSWSKNPLLRKRFKDQLDVLLHARDAGLEAGATAMDRPEDVEIHPLTRSVFVALTNNPDRGNQHGSLLRIDEADGNPLALEFNSSTFLAGGQESGFSCPDNLAFARGGDLLFTTDVSYGKLNRGDYQVFGNNGLFLVPSSGPDAGRAIRLASGPIDSELTGPCFSSDQRTLFLSVQHPGEGSKVVDGKLTFTSAWPSRETGGKPCPALVALHNLPLAGASARS